MVDAVYGMYLDSTYGYELLLKDFDAARSETIRRLPELQADLLDARQIIYGVGNPNAPDAYPLHVCTQKEYRERNERNGQNEHVIGRLCVILLYQYWEDHYRARIASEMNLTKDSLRLPVMGDLRLLRQSIIHHQGIALKDMERCETIPWFREGAAIALNRKQIETIIFLVKTALDGLAGQARKEQLPS